MAQGVYTRNKRFTFVKKTAEEVGDGTDFPMLVTLDQLAEIMYRVKDAWFTAGSAVRTLTYDYGEGEVTTTLRTAPQGTPTAQLVNTINTQNNPFGTNYSYARAYHISNHYSSGDTVPFHSYFDAEYSLYDYYKFRDCNNELGIWFPEYGVLGGDIGYNNYSYLDNGFRCGFSHFVESFTSYFGLEPPPSGFYTITTIDTSTGQIDSTYGDSANVHFTGEVAYVGDSPTSPTAEIYVGLKASIGAVLFNTIETSSVAPNGSPNYDTGGKLVLGLAGGDSVSCKLYSEEYNQYDSVSDFVLQAQEWWPYAKDSPAVPVWDSATGAKL